MYPEPIFFPIFSLIFSISLSLVTFANIEAAPVYKCRESERCSTTNSTLYFNNFLRYSAYFFIFVDGQSIYAFSAYNEFNNSAVLCASNQFKFIPDSLSTASSISFG